MDKPAVKRRSGPRTFDREEALETAMRLFWRHGFEGTSLNDLTQAMGIAPPSLYAAFGSKAELYREALDRYDALSGMQTGVGNETTLHGAIHRLLCNAVDGVTDPARETGCMVSFGLVEHGSGASDVALIAAKRRRAMKAQIADLLAPWLAPEVRVRKAALLASILGGLAIAARDGASREELKVIASDASAALAPSD